MKMTYAVCAVSALLVAIPAVAQVPPPPPQPAAAPAPPPPPPPRFEGNAEVSFVSTTGNTETSSFGIGGNVIYRPDLWVFRWGAGFVRNETDEVVSAESLAFLFRADRTFTDRLTGFGEYDYYRNEFSGIEQRHTLSGGLSYLLLGDDRQKLRADAGLGYTNEQRTTGDDISTALALTGVSYTLKISETAEFTDDLRFDWLFDSADNWRFGNIAAITAKLTDLFSLKLSNTWRYANLPPPGFEATDTITSVALVAKF
ncbi:MAG: putative salt-induced outer membrane protein YdiY [Acidobacteria bacterium]|nr:putative salt-induced outer membrane protein YdiY [Acidobacteriota bacterium]